jgi:D-serine deaminase-like pyridoxal phosphate-dependent protein
VRANDKDTRWSRGVWHGDRERPKALPQRQVRAPLAWPGQTAPRSFVAGPRCYPGHCVMWWNGAKSANRACWRSASQTLRKGKAYTSGTRTSSSSAAASSTALGRARNTPSSLCDFDAHACV